MFMPGAASIRVKRREPQIKDLAVASAIVRRRNSLITEKVITKDLLKAKPKSSAKSAKKIAKEWEREKRLESIGPFLEEFNRFREFYVGIENEWSPKNDGQISCIENIIEWCDQNEVDLGLFIACQFKALAWKPATPSVQVMQSNGAEKYEQYVDSVLSDIDANSQIEAGYS